MNITVHIEGLKGVEDALSQAGPKLAKRALRKALKAGGDVMERAAKAHAPILTEATAQRRPGELRDSIKSTIKLSPKQESGVVHVAPQREKGKGSETPGVWGMFVEFGTVDTAAQPYMRPGFDESKDSAQEAFTKEIRAGVETLNK